MSEEVVDPERVEKLVEMSTQNIATLFQHMNKLGTDKDTPFLRKEMDHLMDQTHKFIRSARQMTKGAWTDPSMKNGLEKKLDDAERTFGKLEAQIAKREEDSLNIAPERTSTETRVTPAPTSDKGVPAAAEPPSPTTDGSFELANFRAPTELPKKFKAAIQNDYNLYFNVIPGKEGKTVGGYEKQLWELHARDDGTWCLFSVPANRWVTAECKIGFLSGPVTCRCSPGSVNTFERWQIHCMPEKPNSFALKSYHGYYMSISKDGQVYAAEKTPTPSCILHFVKGDKLAP